MELIYHIMDTLLPFSWTEYTFMKNALLAVLLMTPLFGLLSTMVVSSRMAFFSDSLGHGAFTGIAVGLVVLSRGGGFSKFSPLLIGDILSITPSDLAGLLAVDLLVVLVWAVLFNHLLLLSVNPSLAHSRGISVVRIEAAFAALLAVVVAVSIQWVGILIINALLVLPGAAARNVARSVKEYHLIAILTALVAGIVGLFSAYYLGIAAGAAIVAVAALIFFLSLALRTRVQR